MDDTLRPYAGSFRDGVVVDLGPACLQDAERWTVLGALAYVVVAPLSLVLVALPGAALVEALGWWLVNEAVLVDRWLGWGLLVWGLAVLFAWAGWLSPARQTLELTPRHLALVRRRLDGWFVRRVHVPLREVYGAECVRGTLRDRILLRTAEGTLRVDVDPHFPRRALVDLVDELAALAREGAGREGAAAARALLDSRRGARPDARKSGENLAHAEGPR